jgi:hypothetical protein
MALPARSDCLRSTEGPPPASDNPALSSWIIDGSLSCR